MLMEQYCSHSVTFGLDRCSRWAVVTIDSIPLCKQHALKNIPRIEILKGVEDQEGLRNNLSKYLFRKEQR